VIGSHLFFQILELISANFPFQSVELDDVYLQLLEVISVRTLSQLLAQLSVSVLSQGNILPSQFADSRSIQFHRSDISPELRLIMNEAEILKG